ncbi:hypothetical protein [Pontibacter anaerobius]|uniref:Uncharacterized protein n=1 Tax=Pontibacter anaerobius TaxID=2993940 RepID=A0ABT3RGW3_9BACT|nr:hypothetical protein [Pontibacter anaerobius]MCX2740869.1 hypothetical protein [Pontibacter anaerobius]
MHLRTRSITLQGLRFYPDTAAHRRLKEKGQASRTLLDIQSPRVKISHINLADLLFRNSLSMNSVVAELPVITQLLDESVENKRNRNGKGSGNLKAINIQKLVVKNAKYQYLVLGQQNRLRHEVPQFSLRVQDLRLEVQEQEGLTKMLHAAALDLSLQDYTYHSSDSVYTVQVRRLSYSSGQQVLKVRDVAVQPDLHANTELPKSQRHRMLYHFRTPLLSLQGLDVAAACGTKQLQLDRLMLEHSDLHILEDLTLPDSAALPGLSEIYTDLSPYLREINVRELRLTDGSFSYRHKDGTIHNAHSLKNANITLQALRLDSATLFTPKDKAFAQAIELATGSYTYNPRNSPYTLKAGGISLSSQAKTMQVEELHLTGDWDKNDYLKNSGKARRNLYDIKLPHLSFLGLDLLQVLRTSRLTIGSISTAQPVIDVRTDLLVPKTEEGPGLRELYQQLSGLVTSLEVGEISIADASITQHNNTRDIQLLQQLEHASMTATGLLVDSAFIFNPDVTLPLQDAVVTAQNYRYQMPDNTYVFILAGLRYSTRQQEFSASTVDVISSLKANKRQKSLGNASRNLYNLSAGTLRITGVDMIRALNTGHLSADILLLRQPDAAILLDRTVAASEKGDQTAGRGLFGLLDKISVNTIRLEDGSFMLYEKLEPVMRTHYLEHATATVSAFELTPASFANLDNALPMQEMTLLAADYTYQSTDSLYTIRLDSVHYSSSSQEVVAHAFTVKANRKVNERLKVVHPELASRNLIDIAAERSFISGFNLIHSYATGQYEMRHLLLAGPKVTILQDQNVLQANGKTPAVQDTTAAGSAVQQLNDMVTTMRVGRLEVIDGTFDFHILEDTIRISQTLEHVTLAIDQLRLVSLEETDPLDIFDVDDIDIRVKGYTFFTRDSLYALEVKEIKASMQNRSLTADSLRLRPLYSKEAYSSLFTYARDRVDMTVPKIAMQGISLRALFNNQAIIAHKMIIENPVVEIYRDNRLGFDPELRPPTLQSALRGAGIYVRLDTILVEKNNFLHPVIAKNGIKPAVFVLDSIQMQAYNVTNDAALIRLNNVMTVNASALFMGVSTLQVHFLFEMDHPEDRYTYEGTLESMDFAALNPLLENMIFIRVKSGWINNASFSVEATGEEANGQVHFPYKNLKVQLLNKKDLENPGFLLKAGSRLVNLLIIKTNNPSSWGRFREGEVEEERDPKRSVSYHMSQSVLDGVTSSLMTKLVQRIVSKFVDL